MNTVPCASINVVEYTGPFPLVVLFASLKKQVETLFQLKK